MTFVDNHCHLLADSCAQWAALPDGVAAYHRSLKKRGLTPADVAWTHHFEPAELRSALERAAGMGLSRITEIGFGHLAEWDALVGLAEEGPLPLAVHLMALSGLADRLGARELARMRSHDDNLDIVGVKFYADGWLGPRTCALRRPFDDSPGNQGVLFLDSDTLARRALPYADAGFCLATHAIGDAAIEAALDGYEALFGGADGCRRAAPRIEHVQVLAPDLVARMADMGVVACIQPSFGWQDEADALLALGAPRMQWAYNWQLLIDAGVKVIPGSDFPMAPLSPTVGLAHLSQGPHPLTPDTAMALMTGRFGPACS